MQSLTYRNEIVRIDAALAFNPALNCLALADDVNAMVGSRDIEDGLNALFNGLLAARQCMPREAWLDMAPICAPSTP